MNFLKKYLLHNYFLLFVIITFNICLYIGGIGNGFLNLDDPIYVVNNVRVQKFNFENLKWAFSTIYFGHWSPFLWLSYMIDYHLGGGTAFVFHIHNVVIHITICFLIFLISKNLLLNKVDAFLATILFSISALNIEPVLWIASRKDVLSAFFFFLALLFYIFFKKQQKKNFYYLSFVVVILGSMVKSTVVFSVFSFLLIDYFFDAKENNNKIRIKNIFLSILHKWEFLVFFIFLIPFSYSSHKKWGSIYNYRDLNFFDRFINALDYIIKYIRRFFFPYDLSVIYNHPYDNLNIINAFIFCVLVFIFLYFCIKLKEKKSLFIVSILFFLINIFPYLQLSQVGIQSMADRWSYVAKYGLVLLVFVFKNNILKSFIICFFIFLNLHYGLPYIHSWKNEISLYKYIVNNNYQSATVYRLLAKAYQKKGVEEKNIDKYKSKIIENTKKALDNDVLEIQSFDLFSSMISYKDDDKKNLLKKYIDKLFAIPDNKVDVKKLKSIILTGLIENKIAKDYIVEKYGMHPLELANNYLADAMKIDKDNLELYISYMRVANYAKLTKATISTIYKLFPNNQRAIFFKGYDYFKDKKCNEAISILKNFSYLNPSNSTSYEMISKCYLVKNDFKNSKIFIKKALKSSNFDPSYKETYYRILLKENKKTLVKKGIKQDILNKKYNTQILNVLGNLYEEEKLYKKALIIYKMALKNDESFILYENIARVYKLLKNEKLYKKYKTFSNRLKRKKYNAPKESQEINVIIGTTN